MSNVLPANAKKQIYTVYRSRFIFVTSLILMAGATATLIALLPTYFLLNAQAAAAGSTTAGQPKDDATIRTQLIQSHELLSQFSLVASSTPALEELTVVLANKPKSVNIDKLDFVRGVKGQQGTIFIAGTGGGRENINAYRVALAADGHFKNVSVPVSVLAGAEEGKFSMTLTGAF